MCTRHSKKSVIMIVELCATMQLMQYHNTQNQISFSVDKYYLNMNAIMRYLVHDILTLSLLYSYYVKSGC